MGGLLKPISDIDAVTVPQLITWAYSMCVATSNYKEYPDEHIMLLNLFRTDMTEGEKDVHLVKQLTGFLAGPAASVVGASSRAQSIRNLQVHSAQVNQSVSNCSVQASSVTGNHVTTTEEEEKTTRLELVRPAPSKYEWEWTTSSARRSSTSRRADEGEAPPEVCAVCVCGAWAVGGGSKGKEFVEFDFGMREP